MGQPAPHSPALLLLAAFSRHEAALDWRGGGPSKPGGPWPWKARPSISTETDYYQPTMGPGLRKRFFAFARPLDPGRTARDQARDQRLGAGVRRGGRPREPRPLNLDPGYLTLGKLVLASTKDFAHRIYLAAASTPR